MAPRKKKISPEAEIALFKAWLAERGGEVLIPTNEYELVRFKGDGATSIVYVNKFGAKSFTGRGRAAWEAFQAGDSFRITARAPGLSQRQRKKAPIIRTLIERDGNFCFYCATEFTDDCRPSREHLIPRTANGPDHISNLFLACSPCNVDVGHLSAPEKIRYRDRKRRGIGSQLLVDLHPFVDMLAKTDDDPAPKLLLQRLEAFCHLQPYGEKMSELSGLDAFNEILERLLKSEGEERRISELHQSERSRANEADGARKRVETRLADAEQREKIATPYLKELHKAAEALLAVTNTGQWVGAAAVDIADKNIRLRKALDAAAPYCDEEIPF